MRAKAVATAAGSSALLLCLLASASPAQERTRRSAPIIRVLSENGAGVVSNYVRPIIQVAEDSYVFAVMMDLDGHIQVLHPDFPGISVRLRSQKQLRLPNFFAGFNDQRYSGSYSMASFNRYSGGPDDTRGTVIALASRVPFNLELIEADGDWNMAAIRRLIEHRTPDGAAQALARYLGAKGERIGRDFMRFAGGQSRSYYAYDSYGYCGYGSYGYPYAGGAFFGSFARFAELRAMGLRPVIIGYDRCGTPLIVAAPTRPGAGFRPLPPVRPPQDTTVFPKSHFPKGIARRPTPEGVFPLPDRAEQVQRAQLGQRPDLPQIRDVTITAPRGRPTEPREIPRRYRPPTSWPAGTEPVERTVPARAEPAAGGMRPVYRPEPRVTAPSQPARPPERAREPAPAPVVRERPAAPSSPPSSPPPRAEPARSKPEPTTTPPPRQ
jgi:hypothetical protein